MACMKAKVQTMRNLYTKAMHRNSTGGRPLAHILTHCIFGVYRAICGTVTGRCDDSTVISTVYVSFKEHDRPVKITPNNLQTGYVYHELTICGNIVTVHSRLNFSSFAMQWCSSNTFYFIYVFLDKVLVHFRFVLSIILLVTLVNVRKIHDDPLSKPAFQMLRVTQLRGKGQLWWP